jgi:hypothetical protein
MGSANNKTIFTDKILVDAGIFKKGDNAQLGTLSSHSELSARIVSARSLALLPHTFFFLLQIATQRLPPTGVRSALRYRLAVASCLSTTILLMLWRSKTPVSF